MKKLAVILSGCGVYDGTEINEAVISLLSIDELGSTYALFAPNKEQARVMNHLTGEEMQQSRNTLVESARIARGSIQDLSLYKAQDFDALVLPGGFGAAFTLSTYGQQGENMTIDAQVSRAILETYAAQKPIAALCIAPVILAKLLPGVKMSIGNDAQTAADLSKMGSVHEEKKVEEFCVDPLHRIYTTPCFMIENARLSEMARGIRALMKAMLA